MTLTDRIEVNPRVMLGKPVIRGTRIPVDLILRELSEGASETDLLDAYPRLTRDDIHVAIRFAADTIAHEEIVFIDKARRYYKKCIIHQDRLVGAILVGDREEFREFKEWITNRIELSEKRLQLLRSGTKTEPVLGKLVCTCNNVGSGNLQQKITGGCMDLQTLCAATGAGTGCGSCRPEVKRILEETLAAGNTPAKMPAIKTAIGQTHV